MDDPNRGHVNKEYNQPLPRSQTSSGKELDDGFPPLHAPAGETERPKQEGPREIE